MERQELFCKNFLFSEHRTKCQMLIDMRRLSAMNRRMMKINARSSRSGPQTMQIEKYEKNEIKMFAIRHQEDNDSFAFSLPQHQEQ